MPEPVRHRRSVCNAERKVAKTVRWHALGDLLVAPIPTGRKIDGWGRTVPYVNLSDG